MQTRVRGQSFKSWHFVFKLHEKKRSEGRHYMQVQPEDSNPWHEELVKKLSGEGHVTKMSVNMDGNAKPTARLGTAPMIAKKLCELQLLLRFMQSVYHALPFSPELRYHQSSYYGCRPLAQSSLVKAQRSTGTTECAMRMSMDEWLRGSSEKSLQTHCQSNDQTMRTVTTCYTGRRQRGTFWCCSGCGLC